MESNGNESMEPVPIKSLVVVFSYHHNNTEKIATVIAGVLDAEIKSPGLVNPDDLREYDLIGFGSGIYSATFDLSVIDIIDRLPQADNKCVFLFSTYGAPAIIADREFMEKNHQQVRKNLQEKGYKVLGEFGCAGWNTNSFLKYFGGLNKGHPDADDLKNAETFARDMKRRIVGKNP